MPLSGQKSSLTGIPKAVDLFSKPLVSMGRVTDFFFLFFFFLNIKIIKLFENHIIKPNNNFHMYIILFKEI